MKKQKEKGEDRPHFKQPPKKAPQIPQPKLDKEGLEKPRDFKSMNEYAKHVMEKKQQEMKEEEERKQAEDPDYKPKKPLSPTMPKKDKEDEKKAEKAP